MKKLVLLTLLILVLAAPITYFIILFVDEILLTYFPNIIREGSKDTWINFFGTLFSGIITMVALIVTIKHENKKQLEEQIIAIRPFIMIEPILKDNFMEMVDKKQNNCQYMISLRVENISNNLVKDLQLVEEEVLEYNKETNSFDLNQQELLKENKTPYCIFTVLLRECEMVAPNKFFDFQTNFLIDNYSESIKNSAKTFKIRTLMKYRDIMDKMEYYHQVEYELILNYTNKGEFILFTDNVRNKMLKEVPIKK